MNFSSQHHSFDIALASQYEIEAAILIHHFQHWIRINKMRGINFKDGRTWTYQTRKEIESHFPYFNFQVIRYWCDKLIEMGVLVTANYNKSPIDKTLWYAFVDEKAFGVDDESVNKFYNSKNVYESGKPQSSAENRTPIPDTISSDSLKKRERKEKKEQKKKEAAPPSADAESCVEFFLESLKERGITKIPNKEKWAVELDRLIKEGRPVEEIKRIITWASTADWYKSNVLSPTSLRVQYDKMRLNMEDDKVKKICSNNRSFCLKLKERYPKHMEALVVTKDFAINPTNSKEVPFNLPEETFQKTLVQIFGGQI